MKIAGPGNCRKVVSTCAGLVVGAIYEFEARVPKSSSTTKKTTIIFQITHAAREEEIANQVSVKLKNALLLHGFNVKVKLITE